LEGNQKKHVKNRWPEPEMDFKLGCKCTKTLKSIWNRTEIGCNKETENNMEGKLTTKVNGSLDQNRYLPK
jgi:hypothetical protein